MINVAFLQTTTGIISPPEQTHQWDASWNYKEQSSQHPAASCRTSTPSSTYIFARQSIRCCQIYLFLEKSQFLYFPLDANVSAEWFLAIFFHLYQFWWWFGRLQVHLWFLLLFFFFSGNIRITAGFTFRSLKWLDSNRNTRNRFVMAHRLNGLSPNWHTLDTQIGCECWEAKI